MDWLTIAIVAGFLVCIGLVTGALAARKGYNFCIWLFAGGAIGLIALAFLPFANAPELSDMEKRARVENGNRIGGKLVVVSLVLAFIRVLASG